LASDANRGSLAVAANATSETATKSSAIIFEVCHPEMVSTRAQSASEASASESEGEVAMP